MRKFLLTSAALSILSITTSAAFAAASNPLVVWQGGATVTSLTAQCGSGGDVGGVGGMAQSVFRPRLDPAEPPSSLTFIATRSAATIYQQTGANDQMHGNGTYTGSWIGSHATPGPDSNTGTYSLVITPAAIVATTPRITIKGTITNFKNTVGCTFKFVGSYDLRPQ